MTETTRLIARLEAAAEGSRELDEEIAFATEWRPIDWAPSAESFAEHEQKHDYATAWIAHAPWHNTWPIPHYTTSLDAALTLVPEGWQWDVRCAEFPQSCPTAFCWPPGVRSGHADEAATPALAFCIAALKARAEIAP